MGRDAGANWDGNKRAGVGVTEIGGVKDLRSGLRIEEEGDESGIMIPSYGLNFGVRV